MFECVFEGNADMPKHGAGALREEALDQVELWREGELEPSSLMAGEPIGDRSEQRQMK